ncbi:MAG: Radical SAM superfamily protein [Chloroflexi bacterium ADurb.Bin325]|nr:MAG: Radical SAM superfamily protein [Chloroflexi bacterium ADurb.Bin325]
MSAEALACELSDVGRVTIRLRPTAINLLVGDAEPSYSFDLLGRLIGAYVGGLNYRRSLDNRVLSKMSGPDGTRQRRWLSPDEATRFLTAAYALAARAASAIGDPRLAVLQAWDSAALAADARRFATIYRPVSILPPDQYLALVLQATEGCSYNRCTFCDFYRDRPFRIKSADELRGHIAAVRAFFGPAIALRRSLFLADANALVAPMARLRAWLDVIDAEGLSQASGPPAGGIYSFIDAFDVHRKSLADWQELAGRGLRRVYIGMESGDDALLRFLRKPGTAGDVIEAVRLIKQAGIAASVIIMTGIGGDRSAAAHESGTIAALKAMPLAAGDIVYFSPFIDPPGSEYGTLAAAAGIRPLTPAEMAAQEARIRAALQTERDAGDAAPPQYARYDIREFVY